MKKIIFLTFTLLLCALAFVGCTKEATLEKNIIGEWETVNYRAYDSKDWFPFSYRTVYEFKTKTGYTYTIDEDMDEDDIEKTKFTYTIEDERLTLKFERDDDYSYDNKDVYVIQSLTAKKMILRSSDGYKVELKKR